MAQKPLDGHRIVDLTHVLAGPYCTYQLGLLGAEVIKVESPKGDMVRGWGGSEAQVALGLGFGFTAQNAGKRSVCVDVKTDAGAAVIAALAEQADIFVENYRPGTLERRGLGYEALRERNPRIIYVSISAFGQNGPHGHRPGFDDVVQATSGYMSINERGDGPIRTGGPVLDYATGMHAASAVLASVLLRNATGEGQRVDIAMQDVTNLLINRNFHIAAATGEGPPPAGNQDGMLLGRFACKDGFVMLAGYLPTHCRSICRVLGLDEYAEFSGGAFAERSEEVTAAAEAVLMTRTRAEWDACFSEAGVVAGGVRGLGEVLDTGQPRERELLSEVPTAFGTMPVTNNGYRINDAVLRPSRGVPRLGEHSREVLSELGWSDAQIDELVRTKVVREA